MSAEIRDHRLGAFVYGLLSGLGIIMILWGLASIVVLPSRSVATFIGLILLGVALLAVGVCREAYLRGYLLDSPSRRQPSSSPRPRPATALAPSVIEAQAIGDKIAEHEPRPEEDQE